MTDVKNLKYGRKKRKSYPAMDGYGLKMMIWNKNDT